MKVDSMDAATYQIKPAVQPTPVLRSETQPQGQQSVKVTPVDKVQDANVDSYEESTPYSQLTSEEKKSLTVSDKAIFDAIEKANKVAAGRSTSCRFSVHHATKRISIKIVDNDSNEVIREIPPEKVLDMVAKLWEMAGVIVDERR